MVETDALTVMFGAYRGWVRILEVMGDTPQRGDEPQNCQDPQHSSFPCVKNPWRRCLGLALLELGNQLTEVTDWSWEVARLTSF
jgi:hypothetical protein